MPQEPQIGVYQNQTKNPNFLQTHRFRVVLHRSPNVVYFVQQANLPGMSFGNAVQPTPFVDIPVPGDKMVYQDFVMQFAVDEDMKSYKEIGAWMTGLSYPKQLGQYADLAASVEGIRSDISLMILDSASNVQHIVRFHNAYPYSISDITFDTRADDTQIALATANFKYLFWEFEEVNASTSTVTEVDRRN